jgi:hypothetical protein
MIRKWLAIGIILLFVGVTISPTINFNTVKASNDDDLVEVTTQACGIQGYGNTTVKLTREQYQDLEEYLVEFRARLNQTSTREEAVPIFKDAVVELDKYGLLPRGMSVERAQRLVTRFYQDNKINTFQKKLLTNPLLSSDSNSNVFCLIAGYTSYTYFIGFPLFLPIKIFSITTFGKTQRWAGYYHEQPAEGWIICIGLSGFTSWTGPFLGGIFQFSFNLWSYNVGMIGFTGIKLGFFGNNFYLGSSLRAKIYY